MLTPGPDGQGQCLAQTMTRQGITWRGGYSSAQTIVGDIGWSGFWVSVEAMLPEQGSLNALGPDEPLRVGRRGSFAADQFDVKDDDRWTLKAGPDLGLESSRSFGAQLAQLSPHIS